MGEHVLCLCIWCVCVYILSTEREKGGNWLFTHTLCILCVETLGLLIEEALTFYAQLPPHFQNPVNNYTYIIYAIVHCIC